MASSSPWVRPLVWIAAVAAMCLPLLASSEDTTGGYDREQIRQLVVEQQDAWNRGDLNAFVSGYDESDEIVLASGSQVTRGRQLAIDGYRERYGNPEEMGLLRSSIHQIDLLGQDHAKVVGDWQLTRQDDVTRGLFTLVLTRRPDGWRVIHDHNSSARP